MEEHIKYQLAYETRKQQTLTNIYWSSMDNKALDLGRNETDGNIFMSKKIHTM
jgi:hypothetical protein